MQDTLYSHLLYASTHADLGVLRSPTPQSLKLFSRDQLSSVAFLLVSNLSVDVFNILSQSL